MQQSGFFLAGYGVAILIWMCISAAFLLLGAKITKIETRSYGKALGTTLLSGVITGILGFLTGGMPILCMFLGLIGGLIATSLLMIPIFKTTFGKALGATALAWAFSCFVIAGPAMLAAILIPAVSKAMSSAAMVQAVSNGANIYRSAFANHINSAVIGDDGNIPFPAVGQYETSTEFFIDLVESGIINVSYDFFAARGIPAAKSTNPEDFKAENNAWCVVLGLEGAPDGTPFMFTRNYAPESLHSGDEAIDLNDEEPFGTKGLVVILKGGSAYSLKGSQLKNSLFNPAQAASGTNLVILYP